MKWKRKNGADNLYGPNRTQATVKKDDKTGVWSASFRDKYGNWTRIDNLESRAKARGRVESIISHAQSSL